MRAIRFVMVGGFLGAGKTTLISRLARTFQEQGQHVCIVTNDQAAGLVDTHLLQSQGFEVNEVAGSCFCCNFNGLTQAMNEFETRQRPDVILAEPVGSCTDLIATIAIPMEERLGESFAHSPYAVVLKPSHGLRILTGKGGGFSPKAEYIFRKQLEESELIILNRIDDLSTGDVDTLKACIFEQFPGREIISLSAKTGQNVHLLYDALHQNAPPRRLTMEVDYDTYADGEAELGWLNATACLNASDKGLGLDSLVVSVVNAFRDKLNKIGAEPAHLKVLCNAGSDTSVANLVSSDSPTMLSVSSEAVARSVKLIVNARVRTSPDELEAIAREILAEVAAKHFGSLSIDELKCFRPGRPEPTYRVQR